ncbi:hypothetical protein OXYTRIMIC_188 [Oxytricha trifallax]|uniref:Uncharacterized protein n=1 Tax=Oxytricha trifallax TaxID=1172189 RepID=A0A073I0G3_9SPIT|nr:hypothetical protein OXYTRIMIC_188 [Oxytricha trifallax]
MTDTEKTIRISDIKKQCWKSFIEEDRELNQEVLEQPVKKCYEDKLENKAKQRIVFNNQHNGLLRITFQVITASNYIPRSRGKKQLETWNIAQEEMTSKVLFVKRRTKNKKKALPIKGMIIRDERVQPGEQNMKIVLDYQNQLFEDDRMRDRQWESKVIQ